MFSRILIANRGEIALRIIRACHELGVEAVAVYSEADKGAPYLDFADEAICIGPANSDESYLNIPHIISAAEITDSEAIHPGYGFLAENINFSRICRDCGITFIGPTPEAMQLLGDKVQARWLAQKAEVPTVPGFVGIVEDENEALNLANRIGYPVKITAVGGSGGGGTRVVADDVTFHMEFGAAKAEAKASFGNNSVYLEKYVEEFVSKDDLLNPASKIGYPVMLKAACGGGGRGMRVVCNEIGFQSALEAAQAEAKAAFGNGSVYLEKLILEPRHVEVQVIADHFGNALHFYERDCTIQRRHQKMIEESPCPVLEEREREELCNAALRIVKQAKYVNAATIEFLLDKDKKFYFIEANTRIQVEHPVTEMVTGHDLIKWQIRVAAGEPIELSQRKVKHNGVAIECRINAEDPANNFAPCPGIITRYIPPGGPGVRLDTHVCQGWNVSASYDSMIAKLIVIQRTRAEAIATMKRALGEFVIEPIKTTIPACLSIVSHNLFAKNKIDTDFVERNF
jgi:acetyl-CoA carboxylase biotin carboxylase subunit